MSLSVIATGTRVPTFETLAERLWWARESAGLTQAELAAQLGIHKRSVQNYEHGAQYPKLNRLVLWANATDVDAAWLAGDFYDDALSAPAISHGNSASTGRYSRFGAPTTTAKMSLAVAA